MEGHSHISPDVLARYAADAAAEVRGVQTKQRHALKSAGAKVTGVDVEVHVVVDYGASVPAVAAEVQRRVSDYLAQMADARPETVHVVVDDIQRP
jgi:uncharacterized alkaline shock family protein YloU